MMFKARNNFLPCDIQKLFTGREGGYNFRGKLNMTQHFVGTNLQSTCTSDCGLVLWNGMEENIRVKILHRLYSCTKTTYPGGTDTRNSREVVADGEGLTGMLFLSLLTSNNKN